MLNFLKKVILCFQVHLRWISMEISVGWFDFFQWRRICWRLLLFPEFLRCDADQVHLFFCLKCVLVLWFPFEVNWFQLFWAPLSFRCFWRRFWLFELCFYFYLGVCWDIDYDNCLENIILHYQKLPSLSYC